MKRTSNQMSSFSSSSSLNSISCSSRHIALSTLFAFLLFALMANALPLSSSSSSSSSSAIGLEEFPAALVLVRPWADSANDWRGQWIRRLSPRVGHLGQMGLANEIEVQKKWTRLEPSIRFY